MGLGDAPEYCQRKSGPAYKNFRIQSFRDLTRDHGSIEDDVSSSREGRVYLCDTVLILGLGGDECKRKGTPLKQLNRLCMRLVIWSQVS